MCDNRKQYFRSDETAILPWQDLDIGSLQQLAVDEVLSESPIYDDYAIERALLAAKKSSDQQPRDKDIWDFLHAVAVMRSCPDDRNCPFVPAVILASGQRSEELSDFREAIDFLTASEKVVKHLGLNSRLAHIIWILNRKRNDLAQKAVEGYLSIVEAMPNDRLNLDQIKFLSHAIHICNGLGKPKPLTGAVLDKISMLQIQVDATTPIGIISGLTTLALKWNALDAKTIGHNLQAIATDAPSDQSSELTAEIWGLCYSAFHKSDNRDLAYIAQSNRAECFVAHAENILKSGSSSFVAAHWLSEAIKAYHGRPRCRERRDELNRRLVEVQGNIPSEMQPLPYDVVNPEIIALTQNEFSQLPPEEALINIAFLSNSPSPSSLKESALKNIKSASFSSIFQSVQLDQVGKFRGRSNSNAGFGSASPDQVKEQIHFSEALRRHFFIENQLEPARIQLVTHHYIDEVLIGSILCQSPTVPPFLHHTVTRGFLKFFQGDFITAIYILTPQLEGMLRNILALCGKGTTSFANATRTQKDITIDVLLRDRRADLDEILGVAITSEIERVFTSSFGPCIRHKVAHALLSDYDPFGPDAIYSCWFIWRLCCLPISHSMDEDH